MIRINFRRTGGSWQKRNPQIKPQSEIATDAALVPLVTELAACRTRLEAADRTTAFLVERLGAAGAALFDDQGPIAAGPTRIPAELIAKLGEIRSAVGAWSPVEIADGLVAISYRINGSDNIRIAAAWSQESSGSATRIRTVADVFAGWLDTAESNGSDWKEPGSTGDHTPDFEILGELISTIPAILYTAEMGSNGRWKYISPQVETILGYTQEEWITDPELWHRSIHPDDLEHAMSFEDERLIGLHIHPPAEYRLRTRDGRYVWVHERARLVRNQAGTPIWHGVIQDLTALKEAEVGLARKVEQQALLAKLGDMAIQGEDPDRLLSTVVRRIAEIERVIEVSIWEQKSPDRLAVVARSGGLGKASTIPFLTDSFPGEQLARGEPVLIPRWDKLYNELAPYQEFVPPEAASSFAAPIPGTAGQFGMILVHSNLSDAFTEEDCDFLLATAGVLGNAIQRARSDRSLHHRLDHDALTELPNRRYFESRLSTELAAAERTGTGVGLVFLDLDHFKLINDGIGHGAGDEVLKSMAPRLSRCVRQQDTVARLGGDEFGIILPTIAGADEAVEIAHRILTAISEPVPIEGAQRRITASAGISVRLQSDYGDHSVEDMIREADAAMYSAKEAGRSQARVFDELIRDRAVRRLEVEGELHDAIRRNEFTLRFQPIIDLDTDRISGFEALARWNHPEEGLLTPDRFIPIAEESELICGIDTWVLEQSIEMAAAWNRGLPPGQEIGISVNSSARQLADDDLVGLTASLLARFDLAPRLLTIELTETGLLSGSGQVSATLNGLSKLGVRLSLDDFGTGFSSLGYLGEFPLDEIKIDRVFIDQLGQDDPRGWAIADAIVRIGRALSMTVVAEAVTTDPTLQKIRGIGCHRAQGYLLGRPLESDRATEMIAGQLGG